MNGDEYLEFLATSEKRIEILELLQESSRAPNELVTDSDLCRRSIQRNLSEFSSRG